MNYHKLCRNEYCYEPEAVKPNQKFDRDRLASSPPMHSLAAPKGERLAKQFLFETSLLKKCLYLGVLSVRWSAADSTNAKSYIMRPWCLL